MSYYQALDECDEAPVPMTGTITLRRQRPLARPVPAGYERARLTADTIAAAVCVGIVFMVRAVVVAYSLGREGRRLTPQTAERIFARVIRVETSPGRAKPARLSNPQGRPGPYLR